MLRIAQRAVQRHPTWVTCSKALRCHRPAFPGRCRGMGSCCSVRSWQPGSCPPRRGCRSRPAPGCRPRRRSWTSCSYRCAGEAAAYRYTRMRSGEGSEASWSAAQGRWSHGPATRHSLLHLVGCPPLLPPGRRLTRRHAPLCIQRSLGLLGLRLQGRSLHPLQLQLDARLHARVLQALDDRQVGVRQVGVLACGAGARKGSRSAAERSSHAFAGGGRGVCAFGPAREAC